MQNRFDGWVPVTTADGGVFYGKIGQVSQWESPFPGWVLAYDGNEVLYAVHTETHKKVYSLYDITQENLKIHQEAELKQIWRLQHEEAQLRAQSKTSVSQYRAAPALLAIREPAVNPFPETGVVDLRLRSIYPSGKIIWTPAPKMTELWSGFLVDPEGSYHGYNHSPLPAVKISWGRANGINLWHRDVSSGDNNYILDCGIMDVADIRVFLPETLTHVVAPPYQTFAYLDFMYNRGAKNELTYFVPSSQSNFEELSTLGYRSIKRLNGDDCPPVDSAIIITMLMRDNGSICYRNEAGNEVLMSCTPFERALPGAAPASRSSRSCWPFCRKSNKIAASEASEGGRNRNNRRNRKQRTIKKHKNKKQSRRR
jgi:hypothetical protein